MKERMVSERAAVANLVTAETSGFFTRHHRLLADGQHVGELVVHWLAARALFTDAEGRQLTMRRTSWWRREHELRDGNRLLATAVTRALRRNIEIMFDGEGFELRATNFWGSSWQLLDATGEPVLTLKRQQLGLRAQIAVQAPAHSDLLAFAYYLLVTRWRDARRRHH